MSDSGACFCVNDLTFSYPRSGSPALSHISLRIRRGATTAIVGLSGSGKTTLLSILGLLCDPRCDHPGTILYGDGETEKDYARLSPVELAELRKRDFGFVLQSAFMLPHFSCAENLAFPLALQGASRAKRREAALRFLASEEMDASDLSFLADSPARQISGGERQRLALFRALIHSPRVIFADEPLNNLDFTNARAVADRLFAWKNDPHENATRSLIIVSHNLVDIFDKIDDFFVISRGTLVRNTPFTKEELPRKVNDLREIMLESERVQ